MAMVKLVINDAKTGKSYAKETNLDLVGMKIGDRVPGDSIGLKGYELMITGGSDSAGFPMRKDIPGALRKRALVDSGLGNGIKIRKTFCGNAFDVNSLQANLKIITHGSEPIERMLGNEKIGEEKIKTG